MIQRDRILIFSPHPDDVELFLGGTLLKHLSEGATVKIVLMSYGEKGSILSLLGEARKERLKQECMAEVRSRLDLAPALACSAMGLPDMGIAMTAQTVEQCAAQFSGFVRPNLCVSA